MRQKNRFIGQAALTNVMHFEHLGGRHLPQ